MTSSRGMSWTSRLAQVLCILLVAAPLVASGPPSAAAEEPPAHFSVGITHGDLWGSHWTPGATLEIDVDGTIVADDVEVNTAPTHWGDIGDFHRGFPEGTLTPGAIVTVTSDDEPPVVKQHTVIDLKITHVDVAADTVAGESSSAPGSEIEVRVYGPDIRRYVEVQSDGTWFADFGVPVPDGGEGWGQTWDLGPGTHLEASERDDDGDATVAFHRLPNPHFTVDVGSDHLWGHDWPANTTLTITITDDDQELYDTTWDTSEWGDFHEHLDFGVEPRQTVTVDDGTTAKTHVVTALTVTEVDTEHHTVSGTTDSEEGSWVQVGAWNPHGHVERRVQVDAHGGWTADFATPGEEEGEEHTLELVPGTDGNAHEHDEDGDATHAGWQIPNPHFNVTPRHHSVDGHGWPPEVELAVTSSNAAHPAQTAWTNEDGHFWLDLWEVWTIEAGEAITVTHGADEIVRTHTVSSLQIDPVQAGTSVITGIADHDHPTNEGRVWVEVHNVEQHTWRVVDVAPDGTWEADFAVPPADMAGDGMVDAFELGAHGNAHQHDDEGNATWDDWRVPSPHFNVNPVEDGVWGGEWPAEAELTVSVDAPAFSTTAGTDEWGNFDLWDVGFDFAPGQTVTVAYGDDEIVKTHVVTALTITEVNTVAAAEDPNTIKGTTGSPAGTVIDVFFESPVGGLWRHVEVDEDGRWAADFSVPVEDHGDGWGQAADVTPGAHGDAYERDEDGDATGLWWHVTNPHFNVNPAHNSVWGHEWTPGSTLTIDVAGSVVADDVVVHDDWTDHWGPGNFSLDLDPAELDLQPGQTVTVTSNEGPPLQKTHTITALTVTEVNPADDTVAGTTDSPEGTIVEVHIHGHDESRTRQVEVDADGGWVADFSEEVDDHGDGWGQTYDIGPGTHGHANERDEDQDGTFVDWHLANPHFTVDAASDQLWGHEWPADTELTVTITGGDPDPYQATWDTSEWGDFHQHLDDFDVEPGQTVTVDDGSTAKTHVVTALTVTEVDTEHHTVSGTTDSGDDAWVHVSAWNQHGHADRRVPVEDGAWTAEFATPGPEDWEQDTLDLVPGTDGNAHEHDEDGDATHAGWRVANPHFNVNPAHNSVWGHEWTPGSTLTIEVGATVVADDVVVHDEWTEHWQPGDFDLGETEFDFQAGQTVTVTSDDDPPQVKTLEIPDLQLTRIDPVADTVAGTTDSPEGSIVEVHVRTDDEWRMRHVEVDAEGGWVADFAVPVEDHDDDDWAQPFDIVPGTHGNAHERDEDHDGTFAEWGLHLIDVEVRPADVSVPVGLTEQLEAHAVLSLEESPEPDTPMTYTVDVTAHETSWESSDATRATVSDAGLVTGIAQGTTTITADYFGESGTAAVTVTAPVVVALGVTPHPASVVAGLTRQFTATAEYSDGTFQNVTGAATWTSSSTTVATISDTGVATGHATGTTTITATYGGHSGTATLSVTPAQVVSVAVTPATASVVAGLTRAFTATATYTDGSTATVTGPATWTSSSTTVATISDTGVATGRATGTTTITATYGGQSGTATLSVTPAQVVSVAVTPAAAGVAVGGTQPFVATATHTDGSTATVTGPATWTSSSETVATISSTGVATGRAAGTTTITATFGGHSGTATLTVTEAVAPVPPVVPIAGANRFATAVEVSRQAFPDGLDPQGRRTVVIATGQSWPDALGGTALAGVLDGPVLLVDTNAVPADVMTEIDRLDPRRAIILGGTGAVGTAVEEALIGKLGAGFVERIAGATRFQTADAVAARVMGLQGAAYDGTAFIATGGNFPDALAAAPLAAAKGWPLFLSGPTALSDGTVAAMAPVRQVVILGGSGAVPDAVEAGLRTRLGPANVHRLSGPTRYQTAVEVASYGVANAGLGWDRVALTTGANFPDALAGGVLQGKAGSVMLLTPPTALDDATAAVLSANRNTISSVTFLGGTGAVNQDVRNAVTRLLGLPAG
jgi:putative cell wall-binding protein